MRLKLKRMSGIRFLFMFIAIITAAVASFVLLLSYFADESVRVILLVGERGSTIYYQLTMVLMLLTSVCLFYLAQLLEPEELKRKTIIKTLPPGLYNCRIQTGINDNDVIQMYLTPQEDVKRRNN